MPPSPSRPGAEARRFAEGAGRRAEALAAVYLRLKGYRILARRVRTPVGELDIVARRGRLTVFVEVKARGFSAGEAAALAAVNRRRIVRAAGLWRARHADAAAPDSRFDVIFLAPFALPRHITGAFDATGVL